MKLFKKTYHSESDLIQDCIKGKKRGQEYLYKQYSPKLFSVCMRYIKSQENAEECLSNGFIKIFDKIHTKDTSSSLEGWMRKVIVNECLQFIRKQQNDYLYIDDLSKEPYEEESNYNYDSHTVFDAIRRLPSGYRTVFNLYAIENYKHIEIAEKLNISIGTSKSQYSKAKKMLQSILVVKGESYQKEEL